MKKYKVLIVDDESINISILLSILGNKYDIFVATDGDTALEILRGENRVDLILLDIVMPERDGFEVAKEIKSDRETAEIPIIFLTAKHDSESIVKAFNEGASDYIEKPFRKEELLVRVENHLHLYSVKLELEQKAKALKISEQHYKGLNEALPVGVITQNLDGVITYTNSKAEDILNLNQKEILGERSDSDKWETIKENGSNFPANEHPAMVTLKTKKPQKNILMGLKSLKTTKWISINSEPLFGERGELLSVISTFTDITKDIENKRIIEQERVHNREILDSQISLIIETDGESIINYNQSVLDFTGYCFFGGEKKVYDLFIEEKGYIYNRVDKSWIEQIIENRAKNIDSYVKMRDRVTNTIKIFLVTINKSETYIVSFIDISDRLESERQIKTLNRQLKSITENIPDVLYRCEINKNWTVKYINSSIYNLTGYKDEDFIDDKVRTFNSIIYKDDISYVSDEVFKAISENRAYDIKYRLVTSKNEIIWVHEQGQKIIDENSHELLEGIISNITLQVEHNKTLQREVLKRTKEIDKKRKDLRVLLDGLPLLVIYKDTKNNILTANKPVADSLGLSIEDLRNVPSSKIFPKLADRYYRDDLEVIKSKKAKMNFIESYSSKDGMKTIETSKIPIFNSDGEVDSLIVIIKDITDIKKLELQSKNQQKLLFKQSKSASMGEMIAAIAHQLKQPINLLGLMIQMLEDDFEYGEIDSKYVSEFVENGMKHINYMGDTIDQFRNFLAPNKKRYNYSFEESLNNVLSLMSVQLKSHNLTIKKNVEDFKIFGISGEMEQVLLNLINNAKDALFERQKRDKTLVGFISIESFIDDKKLFFIIEDNAGGIPKDYLSKIFKPYFTTKGKKGTGIGLYMTKMIVEDSMLGELSVENSDLGAKFTISIPNITSEKLKFESKV